MEKQEKNRSFVAKMGRLSQSVEIFFDTCYLVIGTQRCIPIEGGGIMKKLVMKLASVAASLALIVTATSANSICLFWMHQPELPEGAEQLRLK